MFIHEGSGNLTELFYYAGFDMLVTSATHLLSLYFRYVCGVYDVCMVASYVFLMYSTCNIEL